MAGRVLNDVLRKLVNVMGINWVEALPRALRILHDTPNPITKMSPYEIVFGRERSLGGLPRVTQNECVEANDWLDKMQGIDIQVGKP